MNPQSPNTKYSSIVKVLFSLLQGRDWLWLLLSAFVSLIPCSLLKEGSSSKVCLAIYCLEQKAANDTSMGWSPSPDKELLVKFQSFIKSLEERALFWYETNTMKPLTQRRVIQGIPGAMIIAVIFMFLMVSTAYPGDSKVLFREDFNNLRELAHCSLPEGTETHRLYGWNKWSRKLSEGWEQGIRISPRL